MTNFENGCLKYAPEIIIRGEFWSRYNQYESQELDFDMFGFVNFIEERLMAQPYSNDFAGVEFIPGNEIELALQS